MHFNLILIQTLYIIDTINQQCNSLLSGTSYGLKKCEYYYSISTAVKMYYYVPVSDLTTADA